MGFNTISLETSEFIILGLKDHINNFKKTLNVIKRELVFDITLESMNNLASLYTYDNRFPINDCFKINIFDRIYQDYYYLIVYHNFYACLWYDIFKIRFWHTNGKRGNMVYPYWIRNPEKRKKCKICFGNKPCWTEQICYHCYI